MTRKIFCAALAFLLALCGVCAQAQVYLEQPRDNWYQCPLLRITALNTAQSDCLLLECGGEAMMIDGGSEPYRAYLKAAVEKKGITHFKYLLNTHYHEDHISGLYWLMRYGFTADAYLCPYTEYAEKLITRHQKTVAQARSAGIPVRQVFGGDTLMLGEAVITLYRDETSETTNGKSLISKVQLGDCTILLTADIIGKTQTLLAQTLPEGELDVDIVKAPHHGINAMTVPFWNAVTPEAVFITNIESKAHSAMVQAQSRQVPVFLSGNGDVVMETDGTDWYVYQNPSPGEMGES